MCFLLHNYGIIGKESWTFLGLFQTFLFCRCNITENTRSKKCAVFCKLTVTVRSCEVEYLTASNFSLYAHSVINQPVAPELFVSGTYLLQHYIV